MNFRSVFMGTPDFAAAALKAMIDSGMPPIAVYSQPPRPQGRGYQLIPSPVQQLAEAHAIPVHTPKSFRKDEAARTEFAAYQPDVAVVAAYGLILPQSILDIPKYGCINIHGSLLPRWRGAAPIQRAIEAGDHETGITIMKMDAGLDTGPMVAKTAVPITDETTSADLYQSLAQLGGEMIVSTLKRLATGQTIRTETQPEDGVTYAHKLDKAEAEISDFTLRPARVWVRKIHAFNPSPGCWMIHNGKRIKLWCARVAAQETPADAKQGTFACAEGTALQLLEIQPAGKGRISGQNYFHF